MNDNDRTAKMADAGALRETMPEPTPRTGVHLSEVHHWPEELSLSLLPLPDGSIFYATTPGPNEMGRPPGKRPGDRHACRQRRKRR